VGCEKFIKYFNRFEGKIMLISMLNKQNVGMWGISYVVYWSEFLATDPEVTGSIPGATIFSERGPLSLVRITEELLEWKSSGSGLENRD
jgi:hypothetical protein